MYEWRFMILRRAFYLSIVYTFYVALIRCNIYHEDWSFHSMLNFEDVEERDGMLVYGNKKSRLNDD